jgi:hypothetical protein
LNTGRIALWSNDFERDAVIEATGLQIASARVPATIGKGFLRRAENRVMSPRGKLPGGREVPKLELPP